MEQNKKIKIWLAIFAITFAVAGGSASFIAQKNTFYKGLENIKAVRASVLHTIDKAPALQTDIEKIIQENEARIQPFAQPQEARTEKSQAQEPKKQEVKKSPCGNGIPIMKNSKIIGCKDASVWTAATASKTPAPKIKIIK